MPQHGDNKIRVDLEDKMSEDIAKALNHFLEMCEVVGVPTNEIWASICAILGSKLHHMTIGIGMTEEDFLVSMAQMVARKHRPKKEETTCAPS